MSDSNRTRVGKRERFRLNKQAFNDIFGDPYAYPEPVDGNYNRLRRRSSMNVQRISDESAGTKNAAKPSVSDFFCDCERVIDESLPDLEEQKKFVYTYITEEASQALTADERMKLEQAIGAKLRARKISPASKYFTVVRQPTGGSALRKE
jgi:hypothetical protein